MVDQQNTDLPEGTDTVIAGASNDATDSGADQDTATNNTTLTEDRSATTGGNGGSIADRIRSGREQFASQAGDKARGLVTQGLERTSEALANVAKMVGDTATGIDDRLGNEYGDYARRAAGTIENVANAIAEKDPDELIEDTRNFVRNSPGIALAGAAVVGFVVARLVKSGLASTTGEDDDD
jgi:ElaB/YqjD/DUF883 family membrane-anchored ribosome-binding protein